MKKAGLLIVLLSSIIILMFACSRFIGKLLEDPEKTAQTILSDSDKLADDAVKTEEISYEDAYKLAVKCDEKITLLIQNYPDTQATQKILAGEALIGSMKYTDFKNIYLPELRRKMEALSDVWGLIILMSGRLIEPDLRDDVLGKAGIAYLESSRPGKTAELISMITDTSKKALLIAESALAAARNGDTETAGDYIEQSISFARSITPESFEQLKTNSVAILRCSQAAIAMRDPDLAIDLLRLIQVTDEQMEAFEKIAEYLISSKKEETIHSILKQYEGEPQEPIFWAKYASVLRIDSKQDQSGRCFDQSVNLAQKWQDSKLRVPLLISIAFEAIRCNDIDRAKSLLPEIKRLVFQPQGFGPVDAVAAMLKIACKTNDTETMNFLVSKDTSFLEDEDFAEELARCYLSSQSVDSTMRLIDSLQDPWIKSSIQKQLAEYYIHLGKQDAASDLMNTNVMESHSLYLKSVLAQFYASHEDIENSKQTAGSIPSEEFRLKTMVDVAKVLAKKDRKKEALDIVVNVVACIQNLGDLDQQIKLMTDIAEFYSNFRFRIDDDTLQIMQKISYGNP